VKALNARQARFVAEYLVNLNATEAYRNVYGGKESVAQVNGSRLLSNAMVAEAVRVGKARQIGASELSAARILEELRRMALADRTLILDCRTVADLRALPAELRAIIQDFEVYDANIVGVRDGKTERVRRVRTVPKTQAIEMLAKHFKLLTEVSEFKASDELLARLDRGRERNAARKPDRRK
jgi:phage terminase small subunit